MPERSARRRRLWAAMPPILATGALIGFVMVTFAGLWADAPARVLTLTAVAATLPALMSLLPWRRAGLLTLASGCVGGFLVLALATHTSLRSLLQMRQGAWRGLADQIDQGISGAATILLPLLNDPTSQAVSATLIVLVAMAIFLIAALGMVTRRPLAAVVTAAGALAYRWTLVPPRHPALVGGFGAALVVVMFLFVRPRGRPRTARAPQLALLGIVLVVTSALSAGGASRTGWWDWRHWNLGGSGGGSGQLSVNQSYGPLTYPDQPVELLRVKTKHLAPLRAVTLDLFDGTSFTTGSASGLIQQTRTDDGVVSSTDAIGRPTPMTITLTGAATPWLYSPGPVLSATGLGRREARIYNDGTLRLTPSLRRDTTYRVVADIADPGPDALLTARGYEPWEQDQLANWLQVTDGSQDVYVPLFHSGIVPLEAFGNYADTARLARTIVGNARTPYEAVIRIERYLRERYVYDTTVPRSNDAPELQNFLLTTKRGYCQHFAGSMALMLRMSGIPARVVVGLNVSASRYDSTSDSYGVVDRDAHSWVEVYFGRYGWLPFDPTPGRSAANSASSSSLSYVGSSSPKAPSSLGNTPVAPAPSAKPRPEPPARSVAPAPAGRSDWVWVLPLIVLVGVVTPGLVKAVRRRRRRAGDERSRVLGAVHELESWLQDLGVPPEPSDTPTERAAHLKRTLGIDAARIYGLAAAARFATSDPQPGSADVAWADLATCKQLVGRGQRVRAAVRTRSLRRPVRR